MPCSLLQIRCVYFFFSLPTTTWLFSKHNFCFGSAFVLWRGCGVPLELPSWVSSNVCLKHLCWKRNRKKKKKITHSTGYLSVAIYCLVYTIIGRDIFIQLYSLSLSQVSIYNQAKWTGQENTRIMNIKSVGIRGTYNNMFFLLTLYNHTLVRRAG